jgi:transmembrane sensor
MTPRRPIVQYLESPTDEVRISRMWSAIRSRREAPRAGRRALLFAAAAVIALGVGVSLWPSAPAAIRLADGSLPSVVEAETPRALAFDDGSRIELRRAARLVPIENDGARFVALLASGTATFRIEPGGPRRWTIEAGLLSVEVIGTVFTVERRDDGVRVAVERGVVLVRGERVPDRVRRLGAGEELLVLREAAAAPEVASGEPTPVAPQRAVSIARQDVAPRDPVEDILARADAARGRGDPRAAVAHLARASRFSDDPRAALAAFTMGRLEMDELRRPDRARNAFERALALGLPEHLALQARRRLAELNAEAP